MAADPRFTGIIPACILPFKPDYSIDYEALRPYVRSIIETKGVKAIVSNGHAGEVWALIRKERQEVLSSILATVNGKVPVLCGINTDNAYEAVEQARDAQRAGATGLLIFPPAPFDLCNVSKNLRAEMVVAFHQMIADAVDLPMVTFQSARSTGMNYKPETLRRLLTEVPSIVAVKDWSSDIVAYEEDLRIIRSMNRPISMLSSMSKALLPSLAVGADGILSGSGSFIADLQGALFAAMQEGDLAAARKISDRIFPLAQFVYADPAGDQFTRIKEALVMLGRLERATVRPPLVPLTEEEKVRIRQALVQAQLLDT